MKNARFMETFGLTDDLCENTTRMTVCGKRELYLENYKAILEYYEDEIVVQMNRGKLGILGNDLKISYYSHTIMKIFGELHCIEYR